MLRIGQLARISDVSPHTIRYYERIGVLPMPMRTSAGYRIYGVETKERLSFIAKAQALGLRLAEIRDILDIACDGMEPCSHVRTLVSERLRDIDHRLDELRQLRRLLRNTLERLDNDLGSRQGRTCSAIEAIRT